MLIGISGTLSSGKEQIARYLTYQGFEYLKLEDQDSINEREIVKKYQKSEESLKADKVFTDFDVLFDYITINWQKNMVLLPLISYKTLEKLSVRPYFLHIICDAPSKLRYERFNRKYKVEDKIDFEEFVNLSERNMNFFAQCSSLAPLIPTIKIINTKEIVTEFYVQLSDLNMFNSLRLRPNWDTYFMRLADLAALRSNCMKRRVGCVIVKDSRVIATGYNGTPRHLTNCNEGGCKRCNDALSSGNLLSTCLCLHAEENALLESGRSILKEGCILYCNTCPCLTCSIKIIQSGIKEMVYSKSYSMDNQAREILSQAGVVVRQYQPPQDVLTT